ncbi:hypothetical protein H7F15_02895 [Pontibacter sp. Tf4]|uniref:hypothetical protein n=1 Tax=Pontibacter sp. Tf4 TaxID=2761620 RepID=UPI001626C518|nr:hypothetical protein [Pontibacter sp. Tf4]MBB6609973.1 hypothetical protein [Pontibacter sp. Tf4]
MLFRLAAIISFLLLFSSSTLAQQSEVDQLRESIIKAQALLQQLEAKRDSLQTLRIELQDSVKFDAAIDSLKQRYQDPKILKQKQDSLRHAFTQHQLQLDQLNQAEAQLKAEIKKAITTLGSRPLPGEATAALNSLKSVSAHSSKALAPPNALSGGTGLPPPLQGLAKARAAKAAGNHMSGHEAALNQARKELNRYKGRFSKIESVKDLPRGILGLNPLKNKPWQERVVLGSLWQFGNQERFIIDIGPYAAWRFTDKVASGAGFQYRFSVSIKEKPWVSGADKVGGLFAFTDVDVYKGFFGRLHYDHLSTPVPVVNTAGQVEQMHQTWVPGLSLGIGNKYTFYKDVQGYALVQYNLLHEHKKTPYLQPVQAKIGFFLFSSQLK